MRNLDQLKKDLQTIADELILTSADYAAKGYQARTYYVRRALEETTQAVISVSLAADQLTADGQAEAALAAFSGVAK